MSLEKAQAKLERMDAKMKAAKAEVAKLKAIAAARASSRARQCADISFHLLLTQRPDVIVWVETQLSRDQDKMTFAEWRKTLDSDSESGATLNTSVQPSPA